MLKNNLYHSLSYETVPKYYFSSEYLLMHAFYDQRLELVGLLYETDETVHSLRRSCFVLLKLHRSGDYETSVVICAQPSFVRLSGLCQFMYPR